MGQKTERVAYCPISQSLDVYGDKWSLLIIREMMLFKRNTYGDFLKMEEKIATNILADRLVNLEQAGIITKQAANQNSCITSQQRVLTWRLL